MEDMYVYANVRSQHLHHQQQQQDVEHTIQELYQRKSGLSTVSQMKE